MCILPVVVESAHGLPTLYTRAGFTIDRLPARPAPRPLVRRIQCQNVLSRRRRAHFLSVVLDKSVALLELCDS